MNFSPSKLEEQGRRASGWLDREGKYWDLHNTNHETFANWYIKNNKLPSIKYPVDYLEKQGFVHISFGTILIKRNPTRRQQDALYYWAVSNNMSYLAIEDNYVLKQPNVQQFWSYMQNTGLVKDPCNKLIIDN